jgi:hypothetical protein
MAGERDEGRFGRWFRDPGHTLAVVAVTLIVGVIGGGTVVSVTGSSGGKPPKTVTVTEMSTVTEAAEAEDPTSEPDAESASVGLEALNEEEKVEFDVAAEFGNRNIGGQTYGDAVTGDIYADGSGLPQLTILTGARFSSMHFVVGIDAEAECSRARASVSVENESGRVLWGPAEVSISQPVARTIAIPKPLQVVLVQRSNETESSCDYGEAEVSWGAVSFR